MALTNLKTGDVTYAGAVLTGVYERYEGFDRYADLCDVWTGSAVLTVQVGSGYCTMNATDYGVVKDATPEVQAAAVAWQAEQNRIRWEAEAKRQTEAEAKMVRKGKTVRVIKGRKVPVGTEGVCIWHGDGKYGRRVGIKTAAGEVHWTAETNVEVA